MIETKRLILRPFKKDDIYDLYEYLKEPEVNCFACMKLHSLEEAKQAIVQRQKHSDLYFAIVLKDENKVIGEIEASAEHSEPDLMDAIDDTYSPCWMLNHKYQKLGYAYEAADAFFDYLFTNKNARRIYAYTEDYNLSSQHLCEKLGMRKEGIFYEFVSFIKDENGKPIYENTIQYALLKREWEQKQKF